MPIVPLADVIRGIDAVDHVHVRMAVTQDESTRWILRSLLVDVFPQPWLDNSGDHLAAWSVSDELNDYGSVVFFTGFVLSKDVRAWFANQQDCTLRNVDPGLGQRDRVLTFHIPELRDQVPAEYVFSHSFDGYPTMPWPHTLYVCDMKTQLPQSSADFERLVAPGQRMYSNFPVAREKIVHGVSDPTRSHQFTDRVAVRVVNASGWLKEVRVANDHVTAYVLGMALRGSRVILTGCPEFDDVEREVNRPGQYRLPIPRVPSQFEIALVREHGVLDSAVYTTHPHPFSKTQPHVVVETSDEGSTPTNSIERTVTQTRSAVPSKLSEQTSIVSPTYERAASGEKASRVRDKKSSLPSADPPVVLRVVVASPGDVQRERACLPRVLEELNHGVASLLGLRLELWRWETDASPGFNVAGPQGRIDDAMRIEDSEIVIGIFWKRFGTPVEDARSGTEHELRRAIRAWREIGRPHIMVYFNRRPYSPSSTADIDQWREVLAFRESFPDEGLWWPYQGGQQFERFVRQHLQQYLCDEYGYVVS